MKEFIRFLATKIILLIVSFNEAYGVYWNNVNMQSTYSDSLARRLAIFSAVAYSPINQIDCWSFKNPTCNVSEVDIYKTFEVTETSAKAYIIVDHKENAIVAAFEGTEDIKDWVIDFGSNLLYEYECTLPNPLFMMSGGDETISLGNVHVGFCKYYSSLAERGLPEYMISAANKNPSYKMIVTGHSLGGAAATIAAADLSIRYKIPKEKLIMYTFGNPRVGDKGFSDSIASGVEVAYRVVHANDVVPLLPPCCIGWFRCGTDEYCPYHAGTQVWYNNNMSSNSTHKECDASYMFENCYGDIFNFSISDHQHYFDMYLSNMCSEEKTDEEQFRVVENSSNDLKDGN